MHFLFKNAGVNNEKGIGAFKIILSQERNWIIPKEYIEKMEIEDVDFLGDMNVLLKSGIAYDINEAYALVKKEILEKI